MPVDKDSGGAPTSEETYFAEKTASFPEMAQAATDLGQESGNDLGSVDNPSDVDGAERAQDAEPNRLNSEATGEWSNTPEGAPETTDSGPTIIT